MPIHDYRGVSTYLHKQNHRIKRHQRSYVLPFGLTDQQLLQIRLPAFYQTDTDGKVRPECK
jgi:hypothetical protein